MLMPPDQSSPAGQQYDFIMNADQKPKRRLFNVSSGAGKLLMFVVAGAVLIIILIVVLSAVFGGGSAGIKEVQALAEQQTEIIRVADLGKTKARDKTTLSYVMAVKLTVNSELNQTTNFLKDNNHAVKPKDLLGGKNTATDTALKTAEQENKYDEAVTTALKEDLTAYQSAVKKQFDAASNTKEKTLLQSLYSQVSLLLK